MSAQSKPCTTCGQTKPLNEFYRRPETPDGYRRNCKECVRAVVRARNALPEVKAARRAYNARPERRAERRAGTRKRRAADPEGARQYDAAHDALRTARGPASEYLCVCGEWARHWALDPSAPTVERSALYMWSTDIAAYRPRCASCNLREDAERREREAE